MGKPGSMFAELKIDRIIVAFALTALVGVGTAVSFITIWDDDDDDGPSPRYTPLDQRWKLDWDTMLSASGEGGLR